MFGSVKFFNHQRGFGFIIPEDGGKDLFFHISECQDEYEPQEHDRVQYVVISTPKGEAASEVRFVGGADATADVEGDEVEETQEEDVAEAA